MKMEEPTSVIIIIIIIITISVYIFHTDITLHYQINQIKPSYLPPAMVLFSLQQYMAAFHYSRSHLIYVLP